MPDRLRNPAKPMNWPESPKTLATFGLLLCLFIAAVTSGCLNPLPITPHPTVVLVTHPDEVERGAASWEELEEDFSASPNRNPEVTRNDSGEANSRTPVP